MRVLQKTFSLNLIKCPPTVSELSDFESELTLMVNNIKFRDINNYIQNKTHK